MTLHAVRFPGESATYRAARDALLVAESELRRKTEEVAALRRALPPGGAVPQDYEFTAPGGRRVRLSQLFQRPGASLVLYSFMYGPDAQNACPMCTSMLDGFDGTAPHALQRINLGIVAKSPIERLEAFARERGWRNLPLLSSSGTSYNSDYHGETETGAQMPLINVFTQDGGVTRHAWASELLFAAPEPGMNHRHIDMIWPLWHVFDTTREGRGTDWYPKLAY